MQITVVPTVETHFRLLSGFCDAHRLSLSLSLSSPSFAPATYAASEQRVARRAHFEELRPVLIIVGAEHHHDAEEAHVRVLRVDLLTQNPHFSKTTRPPTPAHDS